MDNILCPNTDRELEGKTREELVEIIKDIWDRIIKLESLVASRDRSEEALRLDEARLEALLKLNDMSMCSEQDIITFSLEEAIKLTGSNIGWIGALSADERTLAMHLWSEKTARECGIPDKPHSLRVGEAGLWMEPILQRKPIIINDQDSISKKGIPHGHVPVKRFLGIPVYDGMRIVAVAEVGNKGSDYDQSDVRQLTLLMGGVWRTIMRKRAEEALMDSMSRAELYVDLMSHDINNMNQIALGFLELALEKLELEGKLEEGDRQFVEKPLDTLHNSAKLIDNVKKLQRLRNGKLEWRVMDIGPALVEVKEELSAVKDRNVKINYTPVSGCYVLANELLKDIFSNLANNSIKHSMHDKPLIINMNISTAEKGYYVVHVEDNGPGICDARKEQIFERLSHGQAQPLRSGLGLGLVKTLVESYKGRIWVEDRVKGDPAQGCRFVVVLPAADKYG